MGDLEVWSSQPHGVLNEEGSYLSSLSPSSSPPSNPDPLSISAENWIKAEQTTNAIICRIQPTVVSERRRKEVIDYIQRLIRNYLASEVFPFGSVPLKTYLPDGDIDLTAFSVANAEDALANDVRSVLEVEEQNVAAEFEVKDVQYIHAEVKLVKCLVQNIVVDISFNQVGGLCTLCFLEQVDRLIGKDHLFKRSIILIKAWCYYESRILGAHHGLISTYALETLVLYIFHLFHASLNGPLAVLYRFLDYFSKFDWDNYCISLNGPVCISTLPEIVAETPGNGGADLLLSKEFLKRCVDSFSVPPRGFETNQRAFPQKHLNIIDPLKENNNLGRSVSKGNFYRIRSAFTYGARKLGRILLLPGERIEGELNNFFMNTLDRHGSGQRPDVQDSVPAFDANGPGLACSKSAIEKGREDRIISDVPYVSSIRSVGESKIDHLGSVSEGFTHMKISEMEMYPGKQFATEPQGYSTKKAPSLTISDSGASASGYSVSGYHLAGDAKDLATSSIDNFKNTETATSTTSSTEAGTTPSGKAHHAPHLYFSRLSPKFGKSGNGNSEQRKPINSSIAEVSSRQSDEESGITLRPDSEGTELITSTSSYMFSNYYEDPTYVRPANGVLFVNSGASPMGDLTDTAGTAVCPEAQGFLADLDGDIDSNLSSLQYGRYCQDYPFCGPVVQFPPQLSSQFQNKHLREPLYQSVPFKRNMYPHPNANGTVPGPPFYPSIVPGGSFGAEEMPKTRGTGTYFPIMNHRLYKDRTTPMPMWRGKNPASVPHAQFQRSVRNNDRAATLPDTEQLPVQVPVFSGHVKPGSQEFIQPGRPIMKGFYANGFAPASEKLEFGSLGHLPLGARSPDASRQPDPGSPNSQVSTSGLQSPRVQRLRQSSSMNQERDAAQKSYHLKDNDDFPPLTI